MKRKEIEDLLPEMSSSEIVMFAIPAESTAFVPPEKGRLIVHCAWMLGALIQPGYIGWEPALSGGGFGECRDFISIAPRRIGPVILQGQWRFAGLFFDGISVDDHLSPLEPTGPAVFETVEPQQEARPGTGIEQLQWEDPIDTATHFLSAVLAGEMTVVEAAPKLLNQLDYNRIRRWGPGAL